MFRCRRAAELRNAFLSNSEVDLDLEDESPEDFVAAMRELLDSRAVVQVKTVQVWTGGKMISSSLIDALAGFDLQSLSCFNGPVAYAHGGQCIARLLANRSLTRLGLPWGPELLQALDICRESRVKDLLVRDWGVRLDGPDITKFLAVLARPSSKVDTLHVPDLFLEFPEFLKFTEDPNCKLISLCIDFETGEWQIGALQSPSCLLQGLRLSSTELSNEEAGHLISQLVSFKRLSSLEILLTDLGAEEEIRLIKNMLSPGSSIRKLHLKFFRTAGGYTSHSSEIYDALTDPGCKLEELWLGGYHRLSHEDQERLVDFLDKNSACPLQELSLPNWKSEVLKANCKQLMERNSLYREGGLQEQEQVKPSSARLFVCGTSGVGKTTITKNLIRRFPVPGWWQAHESTYGIDIQTLRFGDKKLVIHDLAGQEEFHAFHHYFVRGSNKDLFLVVCRSPGKGKLTVQQQLKYWLRFIASHRTTSVDKPRVLVALNYFPDRESPSAGKLMMEDANDACTSITDEYRAHLNIVLVFGLDARRYSQVAKLRKELQSSLEELLHCTGRIPRICEIIKQRLGRSTTALDYCFIAQREKLVEVVALEELRKRVAKHDPIELIKVALENLHDMGEVIYFPQDDQPVPHQHLVIVAVQWFVRDIVGLFTPQMARLTEASVPQEAPRTEVAEEEEIAKVEKKLKGICRNKTHVPYILNSLQQLGVLLLGEQNEVKVLPLLKQRAPAYWPGDAFGDGDTLWGRRLDCKDLKATLIPSGVFAMLQVQLAKAYKVKVGDGWVSLVKNRISVIVKIGGTTGVWHDRHWIDMLMRIPCEGNLKQERLEEANDLLLEVRKCIIDLCGSPKWGCPALELEEQVLHPKMVEELDFNGQDVVALSAVLEEARQRFAQGDYSYTWPTSQRSSYLYELMLPREVKEYLRNKLESLEGIESELSDCLAEVEDNSSRVTIKRSKSVFGGGRSDQEMRMEEKLQEILSAVKSAHREAREAEQRLTLEIRKVGNMIRVLQRQGDEILSKLRLGLDENWPKYPFIKGLDQPGLLKKLSKCTVGQTVYLHFLCEEGRCHQVDNQAGIEVTLRPEWLKKAAPVLVPALRVLFFTARVVAAVYGGGAIPIPSEDGFIKSIEREGFTALVESVFGGLMDDQTVKNIKACPATKAELDQLYQEIQLQGKNLEKEVGLRKKISSRKEVLWVCRDHYSQ